MRRTRRWAVGVAVLATLTACTPAGPAPSGPGRPPLQTTSAGPVSPDPTGTPVPVSDARRAAITADLASRGVPGDFEVVESAAVVWNDGAWGCPQPGVAYTQALVPGHRVVVVVDGVRYDYRFGERDDQFRLCEPVR